MELRQLRYFVAVAEESHFTRAADRLRIAQSGLSASIRALERELGADLFRRNTRQVRLTPEGRALLVEARRALAASDAARDAVAAVQGLLRGSLSIGSLQCLHAVNLPAVLAGFVESHPGLDIRLRHGGSGELIEQVREGRLDLALVSRPAHEPDDVVVTPLAAEPLVLACAPGHPLATPGKVGLKALRGERFVDFPPDWGTRTRADEALAAAGVDRHVALEVTDVHSLLDLVGNGLGVALVPRSFSAKTARVRFLELADPVPMWETVAVSGAPGGAAAAALLDKIHHASH
ncbi:LysR family transcriptional regulator [Microbispora rosea]|uniref:Transcriptional regulator, LysR family n=1 Tax=Microbispora rosea TaxID=58117 RepID=A0A1N7B8B5_9ACTN|nr:LysR family transcriptional regulator [Microbispora rosea]GIH51511.1 transcriptional regulator [Microbispora rosea subsp. rosea]SIR47620.1 transcriptional regulator, LysR family [Microbispora rosea]